MDERDQYVTEYKSLRNEIIERQRAFMQIYTFSISVAGALFGYGIANSGSVVVLAPLVTLVPSVYLITRHLASTYLIAAYIRRFIEPKLRDSTGKLIGLAC